VLGQMRGSRRRADDTRGHRLAPVEELDVNPLRYHARARKRRLHLRHEATRPAKVDVRVSRDSDFFDDRPRQAAGGIEILAHIVLRAGLAVANVAAGARESAHETADFGGEGVMLTIASAVEPPNLPRRARFVERVQHRQYGCRADSGAEEHDGPLSGLQ